jgi:hypothetical protein
MVTCVFLGPHVGRKEVMGRTYDLYAFKHYNMHCNASIYYKLMIRPAKFTISVHHFITDFDYVKQCPYTVYRYVYDFRAEFQIRSFSGSLITKPNATCRLKVKKIKLSLCVTN